MRGSRASGNSRSRLPLRAPCDGLHACAAVQPFCDDGVRFHSGLAAAARATAGVAPASLGRQGCPQTEEPLQVKISRRTFLATASSAAALVVVGLGPGARPLWAQQPAHDVLDLDLHDTARDRPVPVRLYMPYAAANESPAPLVVFSHGIGGSRLGYRYLGSHWAGQGFASLHLQHVGSDRNVWIGGSPFALLGRLLDAAQEAEAIARVHDLRFALDQVLSGSLATRIDARRIVSILSNR